ncbi:MAG: ribosomal protein S18-alanine N-acetyltransferase [Lachnospiraceae bacterium]|nr:ribosomal protein S18-alanine N-acetyltransferase [Candidatus Colinaster equi]
MDNIVIRELTLKDIDAVCLMEEEAFSMPWHKESFIDMINNPDALYLVAEAIDDTCVISANAAQNGNCVKVVGCAGVISVIGEGDICNIVVSTDYRGQGVGTKLVKALLLQGEEDYGIKEYTLEVRVSNKPAIALYEKMGFVGEGVRPGFYDEPKEDALIMWRRQIVK